VNLTSARRFIIEALKGVTDNFTGEADIILVRLLRVPLSFILGHPEKLLTIDEQASIDKILARRRAGEPLQYILGEAFFWGLSFEVGEGVLIPRPDTEFLVEAALKRLPLDAPSIFLDWGTGSGCITIALLTERPKAKAIMAEKNPRSIEWAQKNLKHHGLHERASLWHSHELDDIFCVTEKRSLDLDDIFCVAKKRSFDIVVSNPPYIPTKDISRLMREVRDHEPRMALDGGEDGMVFYRKLFHFAPALLKNGGALILEIGDAAQAESMRNEKHPDLVLVEEIADFSYIPRCMVWERQVLLPRASDTEQFLKS